MIVQGYRHSQARLNKLGAKTSLGWQRGLVLVRAKQQEVSNPEVQQQQQYVQFPQYEQPTYTMAQQVPQYPVQPPPPQYQPSNQQSGVPWYVWIFVGFVATKIWEKVSQFSNLLKLAGGLGSGGPSQPSSTPGSPAGGMNMADLFKMVNPAMGTQAGQTGSTNFGQGQGGFPNWGNLGQTPPTAASSKGQTIDVTPVEAPKPSTPSSTQEPSPSPPQPSAPGFAAEPAKPAESKQGQAPSQPPRNPFVDKDAGSWGAQQQKAVEPQVVDKDNQPISDKSSSNGTKPLAKQIIEMLKQSPDLVSSFMPAGFQDKESIKLALENPDTAAAFEKNLEEQLAWNPQMQELVKALANGEQEQIIPKLNDQGVDYNKIMQTVMNDQECMELLSKPHVMQALLEVQKNPDPATILKYAQDKDFNKVMEKFAAFGGPPQM